MVLRQGANGLTRKVRGYSLDVSHEQSPHEKVRAVKLAASACASVLGELDGEHARAKIELVRRRDAVTSAL